MAHEIYGWLWFGVKFGTGNISRESDCTYEFEKTGFPPSFFLTCSAGYSTVVGLAYFHLSFPNLIPSKFLSSSAFLRWMISINSLLVTHRLVKNINKIGIETEFIGGKSCKNRGNQCFS